MRYNRRITIELRDEVIERAYEVADRTNRPLEDVLAEWLDKYANDLPVETLSDQQVIDLCKFTMNLLHQQELTILLHHHRERQLSDEESTRLDELLLLHRRSLVRKARALQVAEARGLELD